MQKVKVIGVTGGSGSGKSTIVQEIAKVCPSFICISQDNYYKSASYVNNSNITAFNFDHPDSFDTEILCQNLKDLKAGKAIDSPLYDFVHHCRKEETLHIEPAPLIVLDGLMILYDERVRDFIDLKIYVDTPADVRFIRRLQRDIAERGRTVESVIKQYMEVVRPGHFNFIEPSREYADIIIPEGGHNKAALNVITTFALQITKDGGGK